MQPDDTSQSDEKPVDDNPPAPDAGTSEQTEVQPLDQSTDESDTPAFDDATEQADPSDRAANPSQEAGFPGLDPSTGVTDAAADQTADGSTDQSSDHSLSAARRKVIDEILPEVMGARYNHGSEEDQAKFARLLPGVDIEAQRRATPGYTTCGALPPYVLNQLGGVTDRGLLCGGLGGVRDGIPDKQGKYHGGARALGAWVDNDGSTSPRPGDIYILEGPIHYTDKATGTLETTTGIRHIGIIAGVSTTPNDDGTLDWTTADAGQGVGVAQEADYQIRKYDPQARTVTGKADKGTVVGWVDLDLLLEKSAGG